MEISINQLTELTGKTYRTIKSRLSGLEYRTEGNAFLYDSGCALEAIYGTAATSDELTTERTRLTSAQADEKELQVKVLEGDLVPSEQVLDMLSTLVSNARQKLLALPTRATQVAVNASDTQEIEHEIRSLVYEALSELARPSDDPDASTTH